MTDRREYLREYMRNYRKEKNKHDQPKHAKTAAERQREYRLRKKLKRQLDEVKERKPKRKTNAEKQREYRRRKKIKCQLNENSLEDHAIQNREINCMPSDVEFKNRFLKNTFGHVCDICHRHCFENDLKKICFPQSSLMQQTYPNENVLDFSACDTCMQALEPGNLSDPEDPSLEDEEEHEEPFDDDDDEAEDSVNENLGGGVESLEKRQNIQCEHMAIAFSAPTTEEECEKVDFSTLVNNTACNGFEELQPFTVTIATNCLLLVDFHCHIIKNEVVGYLGGNWDTASHNLAVLQSFPCLSSLGDIDSVQNEIKCSLETNGLSLVGWYHSHPTSEAQPTVEDVKKLIEQQIAMRGDYSSSYTPCLGLICSPYDNQKSSAEANFLAYWVMPPPKGPEILASLLSPQDPLQAAYSIAHDSFMTPDLLMEMRLIAEFYQSTAVAINFRANSSVPGTPNHWEKLKMSLQKKLPRVMIEDESADQGQAVTHFWDFLKGLLMT